MDGRELCAQVDAEVFFPPPGGRATTAKRVCALCPLREPCLDYALANPLFGVWGGTTHTEREDIVRRRGGHYNPAKTPLYTGPPETDKQTHPGLLNVRALHWLAAHGWTNVEIARELRVSEDTVARHRREATAALRVRPRERAS